MKRLFGAAIRDTGSTARIPGEGGKSFQASIQPISADGNGHTETGTGCLHRFRIYTACNEVTDSLRDGGVIEYKGGRYLIESIDTFYFGDNPVFRRGILVAGQEDDA